MDKVLIREIQPEDNPRLAIIVRETLLEFSANRCGTVYYDRTTDHLFELFQKINSIYFVAEVEGVVAGGAGIFPSSGAICPLMLIPAATARLMLDTLEELTSTRVLAEKICPAPC